MTATQSKPLTARLDRLTPEGRIAWHVTRAAEDCLAHRVAVAREAVRAANSAAARRLAA